MREVVIISAARTPLGRDTDYWYETIGLLWGYDNYLDAEIILRI